MEPVPDIDFLDVLLLPPPLALMVLALKNHMKNWVQGIEHVRIPRQHTKTGKWESIHERKTSKKTRACLRFASAGTAHDAFWASSYATAHDSHGAFWATGSATAHGAHNHTHTPASADLDRHSEDQQEISLIIWAAEWRSIKTKQKYWYTYADMPPLVPLLADILKINKTFH